MSSAAARMIGKKSERSKAQAKALEDGKVDPAVTRLQGTLEENLDFFLHNIGGLVKDLTGKLEASKTACEDAHAQLGVSLVTAAVEQYAAYGGSNSPVPGGSPVAAGAPAGMPASMSLGAAQGSADADAEAAAAAIAAKVREADERRNKLQLDRAAAAAAAAASPSAADGDAVANAIAATIAATGTAAPAADATTKDGKTTTTVAIVFPDNGLLLDQLKALKKDAYALGTTFDGIHDWIALSIPDYKEEDNTGVEVMGAVIQQIGSLQETVRDVYSTELTYLEERADLEKALLKVPDSETIARQLELHDLDTWDDVERGWRGMIRVSLILFSMLSKNMKALREPRKQRNASLFA